MIMVTSRAMAAAALLAFGCATDRGPLDRGGVHPDGFAEPGSDSFHGDALRESGYPLAECRECHGDDYRGGVIGTSCESTGCHDSELGPVESCSGCHGTAGDPLPETAPHGAHPARCADCHPVPDRIDSPGHLDGVATVAFAGLATAEGATPSWDPATRTCAGTYCHGGAEIEWANIDLGCDACHRAPPENHDRFARVAAGDGSCAGCHPGDSHVDGTIDIDEPGCASCHGEAGLGAPPPALDGATASSDVAVGAHVRHLDPDLGDRIGKVVACERCHPVPASVLEAGHLDGAAPADVELALGGTYDSATGTCTVWCHFDRSPGPAWTDDSGAARACNACHGFPPLTMRSGQTHPPSAPALSACRECHDFSPTTHVDGEVNL